MKSGTAQLPLFPAADGRMSRLESDFWEFHNANPRVLLLLIRYAYDWRGAKGANSKLGIKALFERVRWETALETAGDDNFKLNNNHTAFYARLIMDSIPNLKDIFKLRRQRIASTIGQNKGS